MNSCCFFLEALLCLRVACSFSRLVALLSDDEEAGGSRAGRLEEGAVVDDDGRVDDCDRGMVIGAVELSGGNAGVAVGGMVLVGGGTEVMEVMGAEAVVRSN